MNRLMWTVCCAVFGVSMMVATIARAQESNKRTYAVDSGESQLVDPVPGTDDGLVEKSVLAIPAKQIEEPQTTAHDICRCISNGDSAAVAKIEKVLRGPLTKTGLDFTDTPLEEVVNLMQTDYGIPIQLDRPALDEIGLSAGEPISINLHNVSLQSALRLMLKTKQLTYIINDEVLVITTPEEAEQDLPTCVYDVRGVAGGTDTKSIDALVDTIVSCVATDTWAENGGGSAEIRTLKPGFLVISQSRAVHEEIRGLLTTIRDMGRKQTGEPKSADATAGADENEVITRSYMLRLKPTEDVSTLREQVHELIVKSLPEANWDHRLNNGQAVSLTVFHDRVVVRHKPSIQDKVEELLSDSGIAGSGNSFGPWGGGGGGGVDGPETNPPKREGQNEKQASNAGGGVFRPVEAHDE